MYKNREYSIDFFVDNVYSEEYVIVTASVNGGVRSQRLVSELPNARYIDLTYSVTKDNTMGALKDDFIISTNFSHAINGKHYKSLYQDLEIFVNELNEISKYIIIDISELHIRFLGAFLATLSNFAWSSIIAAYAEPTAYIRSNSENFMDKETRTAKGGFDLNTSFWGYDEIPNLKTIDSKRNNYIWIAFLGFEGKRASAIYQEISDNSNLTIPVITMPAIRPGWATLAFEANQLLFENAQMTCQGIEYVDALNPYAAYNLIEKIQNRHHNKHIVISPLSTRPISLGVLLYALKHEASEVYFDTPKGPEVNVASAGKVHIYDILSFYQNG